MVGWYFSRRGQAIQGMVLIFFCAVVTASVVKYALDKSNAARQAHQACVRAQIVGPYVIRDYERRHVLPTSGVRGVPNGDVLAFYRGLIPASCE